MRKLALLTALILVFVVHGVAIAGEADIVLNELMYNPASDNADDEYIELYNRGTTTVDLSNWYFSKGVTFTFPAGTTIAAGGYLVIARNVTQAMNHYGITNVIGNYTGKLDNAGETVTLKNAAGTTIDTVKYSDVPPWPVGPDGLGQSLELINPSYDNNTPRNWRASESGGWRYVQRTGTATSSLLYLYLVEAGDCLIDDVSIVPAGGGAEYITNGGFEAGLTDWTATGNHATSHIELGNAHSGIRSVHLVAVGPGGSSTNSVYCYTNPSLVTGQSYTLSFWVKYVGGSNQLYSRLSNGGIGGISTISGEGTPGAPNTVMSVNMPPFIQNATHTPQKPTSSQAVTITAMVEDERSVAQVTLHYDLGSGWTTMPMLDDGAHGDGAAGDKVYGATLPARPSQTVVRYKIEAVDDLGKHEYNPYLYDPSPNWGYFPYDGEVATQLPLYFLYVDPAAFSQLDVDPMLDFYVPCTFVADQVVYDGARIGYRGQTSRWYPKKSLKIKFAKGNRFNDLKTINLNSCYADKSFLRERLSWRVFKDVGAAYCDCFNVRLQLNGQFQGLYAYVEQPNDDWLARIGRDDTGNLYKSYGNESVLGSTEAYWYTYEKKTNVSEGYDDLIAFTTGLNYTSNTEIAQWLTDHMVVDSLMRFQVANTLIHNLDWPWKNHYMYHDLVADKWEMFVWDVDLTWGRNYESSGGVCNDVYRYNTDPRYSSGNSVTAAYLWRTTAFQGEYFAMLYGLVDTLLTPAYLNPIIDAWTEEIRPEAALDRAKWGSYGGAAETYDIDYQKNLLKQFVLDRRNFLTYGYAPIDAGWNWISFAKLPTNGDPTQLLPRSVIENKLFRWNPVVKTYELYPNDFQAVEFGRGYLLFVDSGVVEMGAGGTVNRDMVYSIPVPEQGWIWVGLPRTHDMALDQLSVRNNDTGQTRTAAQDYASGGDAWINWNWLFWDSRADTARILSFSGADDTNLHPWRGYRLWANRRNLTILVPR